MLVLSEVKQIIRNGATFAIMRHRKCARHDVYWLKFAGQNGFEIRMRLGRMLEKQGFKPEEWAYTA